MTQPATSPNRFAVLALGTVLACAPLAVDLADGPTVGIAKAFAKNGGDDDRGGDSSGRGGDDSGRGDDTSGHGGDGGGRGGDDDDDRSDDRSGRSGDDDRSDDRSGRGSDDDRNDDSRGRGSDDDRDDDSRARGGRGSATGGGSVGAAVGNGGDGLRVVKVERNGTSVEVVYSNGVKEEIEAGRYELKNAAGRTVVERPATRADLGRIGGNVRNSGLLAGRGPAGTAAPGLPAGSQAASVEVAPSAIEVRYTTGWKEEIEAGRYELKDPNNNTVVERPATAADRRRLEGLAGG